jgi:gamma-glutamyltranspeptidase/glutathione hydrolase
MGVVDFGMNIQQSIDAPRFHNQWLPDVTFVEDPGISPDTIRLLRQMGHKVELSGGSSGIWSPSASDGECIAVDVKTGERLGASDARHDGKPLGF